jgi:DNA repair protein RadC
MPNCFAAASSRKSWRGLSSPIALFAFIQQEIGFAPSERLLALFVHRGVGLIRSEIMAAGTVRGTNAQPFAICHR